MSPLRLLLILAVLVGAALWHSVPSLGSDHQAAPSAPQLPIEELLGTGQPLAAPGEDLSLVRLTWVPGASIPQHTHPGSNVFYVESGTLVYALQQGHVTVSHAAVTGRAAFSETLQPGAEATLTAGDWLFYDEDVVHTGHTVGDAPATVLVATLYRSGEPPVQPLATPIAP